MTMLKRTPEPPAAMRLCARARACVCGSHVEVDGGAGCDLVRRQLFQDYFQFYYNAYYWFHTVCRREGNRGLPFTTGSASSSSCCCRARCSSS